MRAPVLLLVALVMAADALAATVRLRSKANGNIIEAEIVEVTLEKVAFRLPGGERLYDADWESLDTEWIRRNSPGLWAERELLLKPAEDKSAKPKDEGADPFAKEAPPASAKDVLRNLASALEDRLRGPDSYRIESFCRESGTDEAAFWKAFDEMRRASGTLAPAKEGEKTTVTRSREKERDFSRDKDRDGDKRESWRRDPALRAKEEAFRRDTEKGAGSLTATAYLRAVADGGFQGRIAWQLLRHLPDDRKAILDRLQKYEKQAAELAERAEQPDAKRDALVLRKQIADLIASLGRVSKDNSTQEERLRADCNSLLSRLSTGR
ncbi:MAG: hypothetical protein ACK5VI_04535 [Opitutia bacterium]|jgi:hypothetical protein